MRGRFVARPAYRGPRRLGPPPAEPDDHSIGAEYALEGLAAAIADIDDGIASDRFDRGTPHGAPHGDGGRFVLALHNGSALAAARRERADLVAERIRLRDLVREERQTAPRPLAAHHCGAGCRRIA